MLIVSKEGPFLNPNKVRWQSLRYSSIPKNQTKVRFGMKKEAKKQKELAKLRRMQEKSDFRGSMLVMIGLILFFQVLDMMATNVYTFLQESVVMEYAGLPWDADITPGGSGYDAYQSTLSLITYVSITSYAFMGIAPFYKSLADKVGRKPIFVINAVGLGIAMFVAGITGNIYIYIGMSTVIMFFTLHDMQLVYVTECLPAEKRATWNGIVTAVGNLAECAVVLMRFFALQPDGTMGPIPWRSIYMIIGVVGLAVFVVSLIFLRESPYYIQNRIAYLEKTPEQLAAEKANKVDTNSGIVPAIKMMIRNKQLRWLAISTLIISAANNMLCSYNTTILVQNGLDTANVTIALALICISNAVISFFCGHIADKAGRKWTCVIMCALCAATFSVFVFISDLIENQLLCAVIGGISAGIGISCYCNMNNLVMLMMSESCPASVRSSIIGARSFFMISAVVAIALAGGLFTVLPTGTVCFILSVPFLIVGCILLMLKTKETRGMSMEELERQFAEEAKNAVK